MMVEWHARSLCLLALCGRSRFSAPVIAWVEKLIVTSLLFVWISACVETIAVVCNQPIYLPSMLEFVSLQRPW
jgi:hypothetical protein